MPRPSRPESDWMCSDVLDAKSMELFGQCDFCETRIRWIHVLEHDDYPSTMYAGCCCAQRLCFDYDAEAAERALKNRMGRLARFVDRRRWKPSKNNPANIWRWARMPDKKLKVRVTVFLHVGSYGISLKGPSVKRYHWERFASQAEAMNVAFELIEQLKNKT